MRAGQGGEAEQECAAEGRRQGGQATGETCRLHVGGLRSRVGGPFTEEGVGAPFTEEGRKAS
ncbi:hypothetical protein GCM10009549_29200 [Streptomyces thermoalcalitolerans]|uniref:Uncharacterized protein n=1 Tax=Streptomyces thermoalcalitolerans TaxID=65605 RepID=A0ABN1NQ72_9ACTN